LWHPWHLRKLIEEAEGGTSGGSDVERPRDSLMDATASRATGRIRADRIERCLLAHSIVKSLRLNTSPMP
jgi:hypothetical protein